MTNGHNHPPRCCCAFHPSSLIGAAQPEHRCPACPDHGDLAGLAQPAPEPECPHCHAHGDQPHTDYCPSGRGWEHAVTPDPVQS